MSEGARPHQEDFTQALALGSDAKYVGMDPEDARQCAVAALTSTAAGAVRR